MKGHGAAPKGCQGFVDRWMTLPLIWSSIVQWVRILSDPTEDKPIGVREKAMVKVLFVCMGNICRSPMAEGTFRRLLQDAGLADKVYVDSAGTHSYHIGARPDERGQHTARRRGVELSGIRARQVLPSDLLEFDYVLAMDRDNYAHLLDLCERTEQRTKLYLLMDFAAELPEQEVPDPYYGGLGGFERVMDLLEVASEGLLRHIRERYHL